MIVWRQWMIKPKDIAEELPLSISKVVGGLWTALA
jgi:hypothetical protein